MGDCDVCIGVEIDEARPEFHSESFPVARKPYKCCECGEVIPIGDQYFKAVGKWDGSLDTYRQCLCCHEIQQVFSCGEGYYYGGLWESWDEADAFQSLRTTSPCFNQLSVAARSFLTARWWKWKEAERA